MGAVSRAVRTPSRIDRDFYVSQNPPFLLAGGPNFGSEKLLTFEWGYNARVPVFPHRIEWDGTLRYVDALTNQGVPRYVTLDLRLG